MFDGVNEIAILVTALLAIAVGSVWYSPLVFGKHWMTAASLTDDDLQMPQAALLRSLAYAFVGNVLFVYVIARLILIAEVQKLSLVELDGLLILFLAMSMTSVVVWEKKSLAYFAIHVGYAALVVSLSSIVLSMWPW